MTWKRLRNHPHNTPKWTPNQAQNALCRPNPIPKNVPLYFTLFGYFGTQMDLQRNPQITENRSRDCFSIHQKPKRFPHTFLEHFLKISGTLDTRKPCKNTVGSLKIEGSAFSRLSLHFNKKFLRNDPRMGSRSAPRSQKTPSERLLKTI